jgi:hypothetical protein
MNNCSVLKMKGDLEAWKILIHAMLPKMEPLFEEYKKDIYIVFLRLHS